MNTNETSQHFSLELKKNDLDDIHAFFSFCIKNNVNLPDSSILFPLQNRESSQFTSRLENLYSKAQSIDVPDRISIDYQWLDQVTFEFQDDFLSRNPEADFSLLYNYFQKIRDFYTEKLVRYYKDHPHELVTAMNGMNRFIDINLCTLGQNILNSKQRAIDEQQTKTDRVNKELEQFVYITSHDLQQPLTSLISISGLLEEEFPELIEGEQGTYIRYIRVAAKHMSSMITDLLNHSRIGRWSKRETIDLNKVMRYVLNDLNDEIRDSGAEVNVSHLPSVSAYPVEIKFLFENLISNAIKFRKEEKTPLINIMCEEEADRLHFMVQDNGIGIDEKYLDKVFVIFQKLHLKNDYKGNGAGLAHCKKIVKLHGGKIWVDSIPDIGSTFHFTLDINNHT